MATITTGVLLFRWPLLSAVLMFLASALNIRFRKSEYIGLAAISSTLGVAAACWFATDLLGINTIAAGAIWENMKVLMVEIMSQTPPNGPIAVT